MALPIIGYRTILRNAGAVITASSTATGGFDPTNVADLRAYTLWKAGSTATPQYIDIDLGGAGSAGADYLAVVNGNAVAIGAQLKVYADTVFPPTNVAQAAYSPTSDEVEYKGFASPGSKRYWRLEWSAGGPFSAAPYCGQIQIGLKTSLNEYPDASLDPYWQEIEVKSNRGNTGHALGVTLRGTRRPNTIVLGGDAGVARADLTSDLNAFLSNRALRREPFVFVHDSADSDFGVARWLKMTDNGKLQRLAVGGTYARFKFALPVQEALMVPAPASA